MLVCCCLFDGCDRVGLGGVDEIFNSVWDVGWYCDDGYIGCFVY